MIIYFITSLGMLKTLYVGLSYFFVCQDMAVQVMHSLHNCTAKRWKIVSWVVVSTLTVACVLLGMLGSLFIEPSGDGDNLLNEAQFQGLIIFSLSLSLSLSIHID